MKKTLRWLGILIGVLLVAVVALPFLVDPNDFRPMLESTLTRSLGRPVKLGDLKLAILSGGVTANDLSIADDPAYSKGPFVQAQSLKIGVELWPLLLSKKLNVTALTIDRPQIQLIQSASGDWNFSSLGAKSEPKPRTTEPAPPGKSMDLSVKLVKISTARFSLGKTSGRAKPLVLDPVDLEVRDFSAASAFPFTFSARIVGGGELKLDGKVGPVDSTDASLTPWSANIKLSQFDLAGSGWTQAAPGMGGVIGLDGSGECDSKTVTMKGRIQAERLKLAQNGTPASRKVALDFAAEHNLKSRGGRIRKGDIRIGEAAASLTGTYAEQHDSTTLNMSLSGPNMAIPELAAMLPAMGIVLPNGSSLQGGTAAVKLDLEGPTDRLVTAGTVAFNNTTLAGFDLGKKMAVIETLAGIKGGPNTEIQVLSTNLRMSPEGMTAENLQLVVPAIGELGGSGTVSPTNALDFKMNAKVHTSGTMAVLSKENIPFFIQGTSADPVFRPDVKSIVTDKAKTYGTKAAESLIKGLFGGKKD